MRENSLLVIFLFILITPYAFAQKQTIILTQFKTTGIPTAVAEITSENLTTYFLDTQKFDILERAQLVKILEELKLSSSDLVDEQKALKAGKLLPAYGIILGSIIKLNHKTTLSARLVSIRTGKIIRSAQKEIAKLDELPLACKYLAYKLADIPFSSEELHGEDYTSLIAAIVSDNLEKVKLLVKNGMDVNKVNDTGVSALMHAAYYGKTEIVQYLLTHDAQIEQKDIYGQTALLHAAQKGKTKTMEFLLKMGANINASAEKNNNQSALMYACYLGYQDVVKLLIKKGANLNQMNSNGHTALFYAISQGHKEIANLLWKAGGRM